MHLKRLGMGRARKRAALEEMVGSGKLVVAEQEGDMLL